MHVCFVGRALRILQQRRHHTPMTLLYGVPSPRAGASTCKLLCGRFAQPPLVALVNWCAFLRHAKSCLPCLRATCSQHPVLLQHQHDMPAAAALRAPSGGTARHTATSAMHGCACGAARHLAWRADRRHSPTREDSQCGIWMAFGAHAIILGGEQAGASAL